MITSELNLRQRQELFRVLGKAQGVLEGLSMNEKQESIKDTIDSFLIELQQLLNSLSAE